MSAAIGRLRYFLGHPSEYAALWTLDLTLATVLLAVATLWIVIRQLRLMQRQTGIMAAQDDLNRALLARRAKLWIYAVISPSMVKIGCKNIGDKAARGFYWHLAIPVGMPSNQVWDGAGTRVLHGLETMIQEGMQCTQHSQYVGEPLFPTRTVAIARFSTLDPNTPFWWKTVSEDGVEPSGDDRMNPIERQEEAPPSRDA